MQTPLLLSRLLAACSRPQFGLPRGRYVLRFLPGLLLLLTCLSQVRALPVANPIRYVKAGGTGDGSSWTNASGNLQAMINASGAEQVWVAGGTFKPTTMNTDINTDAPIGSRSASFEMKNNVAIYGGFVGTETSLNDRPSVNPVTGTPSSTTLSGDIGTLGNNSDNSYHIFSNSGLNSTAVLDGFVITGGNANGSSQIDILGGGIFNSNSSPTITNCSLMNNQASRGGGIYNVLSSPILTNCNVQGNSASKGGGIYNSNSNPTLTNCRLQKNKTPNDGGGIYNDGSSPKLTNCSLEDNSAGYGGGIVNVANSSPTLTNCSLFNNFAFGGGGINNNGNSNPTLVNCVLWGNGGSKTIENNSSTLTATYSLFDNTVTGYTGTNNKTTTTSPFAPSNGVALAPGSPAIDAGSNQAYGPNSPTTDLAGNLRFSPANGTIDMGAIEFQTAPAQPIRYVKTGGTGDGSSWTNASSDLQAMINATSVTQVWVAGGTYKPTSDGPPRTASFNMKNGVAIYGGFMGTETNLTNRPAVNPLLGTPSSTTLSGDIGVPGVKSDDTYHVVYNPDNSDLNSTAVLDGFVITGGNASGGTDVGGGYTIPGSEYGGGIYNNNSSPTITNCSLMNNQASRGGGIYNVLSSPILTNCNVQGNSATSGGGIYNSNSNPTLTNCSLMNNSAVNDGGGIYNEQCSPTLTNCSLQNNAAGKGGGIYNTSSSSPRLTNCNLQSNSATNGGGGGIYNNSSSNPTLTNCSLINNAASKGGGIYTNTGSPVLINCSLLNNTATSGGGIFSKESSNLTLANCVLWQNGAGNSIYKDGSSTLTATYSLFDNTVTGYTTGPGNLTTTTSPFVSANSVALAANSPAIDAGSNQAYGPKGPQTDLVGNPRFFPANGTIDMGAVESQTVPTPTATKPVAPALDNQTATVNMPFSYVVPAFTGTDPITYKAIGLPQELTFNAPTLTISGTPKSAGMVSVTIEATNAAGTGTGQFTITVSPAPVVSGPFAIVGVTTVSCTVLSAGQRQLSFTPQYSGLNGQPVSFSVANELSPTTAPGPYSLKVYTDNPTITLRAVQSGTAGEVSFAYNWLAACNGSTPPTPANQAPTTTGIANQNGTVGQPFSLNVAPFFSDPNGDALSFAASGLPTGLSLSGSTISGMPGALGVSSVTVTATDLGNLSVKAIFELTVNPAKGDNPPTAPFGITGVTTVSCTMLSAGQRQLSFTPQYAGTNGQPISFSVANELSPTTAPGPYTLKVYTDNPTITLKAIQQGTTGEVSFAYNWLAACNTGKRIGVTEPVSPFRLQVLGNPVQEQVRVRISGADGQAVRLRLTDLRGRELESRLIEPVSAADEQRFDLRQAPGGVLLLQAISQGHTQLVKIIHQ